MNPPHHQQKPNVQNTLESCESSEAYIYLVKTQCIFMCMMVQQWALHDELIPS